MHVTTMTDEEFAALLEQVLEDMRRDLAPKPGDPKYERRQAVVGFAIYAVQAQAASIRRALERVGSGTRPFRPAVPRGVLLS